MLAILRDAHALDPDDYSTEHIVEYCQQLFSIADTNGDGVLQPSEFRILLQNCGFDFDDDTVSDMIEAADTNHDGVIQYEEFLPAMLSIMETKKKSLKERPEKQVIIDPDAFSTEEIIEYLNQLFKIGDANLES